MEAQSGSEALQT